MCVFVYIINMLNVAVCIAEELSEAETMGVEIRVVISHLTLMPETKIYTPSLTNRTNVTTIFL